MKGEKRMKKLTYQAQIRLSIGSLVLCFLMAHITKQGSITNVAWIITGLLFIINPVWPKMWDWKDHKPCVINKFQELWWCYVNVVDGYVLAEVDAVKNRLCIDL